MYTHGTFYLNFGKYGKRETDRICQERLQIFEVKHKDMRILRYEILFYCSHIGKNRPYYTMCGPTVKSLLRYWASMIDIAYELKDVATCKP